MKSYSEIHLNRQGKLSDKWEIYLEKYDEILSPYRHQSISMLEIGVQNGGSLESWSEFFPNAKHIVGCDINPDIEKLRFDDERITLFVADAADIEQLQPVIEFDAYDIILDDGSHTSSDIIKTFCHLFPKLNNNGIYIVEDLHCSYWQEYEGGLYAPFSSMGFLKKLSDIINHEHWGVADKRSSILDYELSLYDVDISEDYLAEIHAISFYNSICVIQKKEKKHNQLGVRLPVGSDELVVEGHKKLVNTHAESILQEENIWSTITESPIAVYYERQEEIQDLRTELEAKENELLKVYNSKRWQLTKPLACLYYKILGLRHNFFQGIFL